MRNQSTRRRLYAALFLFFFGLIQCYGQSISSNPTYICRGANTEYTVSGLSTSNPRNYSWDIESGTYLGNPASNTTTFNVTWLSGPVQVSFSYTYDVVTTSGSTTIVTPTNATILSSSQNLVNPVGVTTSVSISATPGNTICLNKSTKLIANISGGTSEATYTYLWSNAAQTKEVTVSPGATTAYTVQAWNQCDAASFNSPGFTVNVNSLPDFNVSSSAGGTVCPQTQVTLTATPTSPSTTYTYAWTPATTPTTGSQVAAAPGITTTYTVTATNPSTGCQRPLPVTVNVYPVATVQLDNTHILACGNPTNFTVTASGAYSYTWSPSTGLNTTTGATVSGSIDPNTTPVVYTVTAKNNDPCTNTSASAHVIIYGGPPKPETIYGYSDGINGPISPAYLCINPPDQTYSITTNTNNPSLTHYYWYFTTLGGASMMDYSGDSLTSVLAHFNTGYTGGKTLEVEATNACGTAIIGSIFTTIDASLPATPSLSGVPANVCNGSNTNITLSYMTSGAKYEITPSNAVNWNNTTMGPYGSINIDWDNAFIGTATIKARVLNGCGYSAYSPTYSVNVQKTPTIFGYSIVCSESPSVSYSLGQMTANTVWTISPSGAGSGFNNGPYGMYTIDWNTPGQPTTTATLNVTYPGMTCPVAAKTITISPYTCNPSGRKGTIDDEGGSIPSEALTASIHPNPFSGSANLKIEDILSGNTKVEIFNATGVKVYGNDNVSSGTELEIGQNLEPGIYIVKIRSNNEQKVLKFIKQD